MRSFVKIKPSRIDDITLSFTDIFKSCPVRDFFYVANVSFHAIRENKFSRKFPNLQYNMYFRRSKSFYVAKPRYIKPLNRVPLTTQQIMNLPTLHLC